MTENRSEERNDIAKILLEKAVSSFVRGIDQFNHSNDRGRVEAVLIMLDHAFEMLLKASITVRGGEIFDPSTRKTIGFDACTNKSLTDATVKFLTEDQAVILRIINALRDCAQHYFVEVSEHHLYIHAQAGASVFRDVVKLVFSQDLAGLMPERVLPISTVPPKDLAQLYQTDAENLKNLLEKSKFGVRARAKLKTIALVDWAISGEKQFFSEDEIDRLESELASGKDWQTLFKGVAQLGISIGGDGPTLNLKISKNDGIPIRLVTEGAAPTDVIAIRKINELDFYSLTHAKLSTNSGLTPAKTTAVIRFGKIKENENCFKEFRMGKARHGMYSPHAIDEVQRLVAEYGIDQIWKAYSEDVRLRGASKRKGSIGRTQDMFEPPGAVQLPLVPADEMPNRNGREAVLIS